MQGGCQGACGCSRICGLSVAECVVVGVVIGGIEGLRQGRRNGCCESFGGFTPTCTGLHGRPKCGSGFGRGVAQPVLVAACWWQGLVTTNRGHWASLGMVLPLRSLGVVFVRGESPCVVYSCSRAA